MVKINKVENRETEMNTTAQKWTGEAIQVTILGPVRVERTIERFATISSPALFCVQVFRAGVVDSVHSGLTASDAAAIAARA